MTEPLKISLGIKSDPIEYRYTYEWLFRILADEGVKYVQMGTFFEIYQLPDQWFVDLRKQAEDHGLQISSMFTAHRELGGFFREEPAFSEVAHNNFARLIEVGSLLGAAQVGSNPGAVMRDTMDYKDTGMENYIKHMKTLMTHAKHQGLDYLTIEPMSCLAEPPTLPDEMRYMAEALMAYHHAHPEHTVPIGFCGDISHGYANCDGNVIHSPQDLILASLPWLTELHLKNTDARFESTFGFDAQERERGIINLKEFKALLVDNQDQLPVDHLIAYLEIGGPKTGRDYSDAQLESALRDSLQHCKEVFEA